MAVQRYNFYLTYVLVRKLGSIIGFQIRVDLNVYAIDAVTSASYKYTDRFYIHQETTDGNAVNVLFESKSNESPITIDVAKQYCNELIDQQVRYIVNRDFGHIRDLIVEEAFKPVNKRKSLDFCP